MSGIMSSEQDPLLPLTHPSEEPDDQVDQSQTGLLSSWRTRVAKALESDIFHKFIITLVRIPNLRAVFFLAPLTPHTFCRSS